MAFYVNTFYLFDFFKYHCFDQLWDAFFDMNIFYLDQDVQKCADYHCDKHVVKMILEYAQLLCSAVWISGQEAPYRPTHIKHPCALWVSRSLSNWRWLKKLAEALNQQYRYRFGHNTDHRSWSIIQSLKEPNIPDLGITERPQVMPEKYRVAEDPVKAYRQFYLAEKQALLQWRKVGVPIWVVDSNVQNFRPCPDEFIFR